MEYCNLLASLSNRYRPCSRLLARCESLIRTTTKAERQANKKKITSTAHNLRELCNFIHPTSLFIIPFIAKDDNEKRLKLAIFDI